MSKPRVQYVDCLNVTVGKSAVVNIKERGWVRTTNVEQLWPHANGPLFETKNTIYAPPETDESNPYKLETIDEQTNPRNREYFSNDIGRDYIVPAVRPAVTSGSR